MSRRIDRWIATAIFIVIFGAELGWGIYAMLGNDYISGDSLSRVANAFYVLHSRDPHLGAIGFVWNPLPSMLELIPLLLWRWLPAIASAGLASAAVTAAFAGGSAVVLYLAVRMHEGSRFLALALALTYAANPFNFMYGANGMSESIFSFFIIASIVSFTRWTMTNQTSPLVLAGLSLAMGFWTRYEAVALGVGLALCFGFSILSRKRPSALILSAGKERRASFDTAESTLIVLLLPSLISGGLWMLFNYLIMGDALYFLHSGYSNLAFAQELADNEQFVAMIGNPLGVLQWVARKSVYFSIPLASILFVRLITKRLLERDTAWLLLLACSIPAMQFYLLFTGASYGWLRFFVYTLVVAAAWIPYELHRLKYHKAAKPLSVLLIAGMLGSSFVVLDMNNPTFATEEYEAFHMKGSNSAKDEQLYKEIAKTVDELVRPDKNGQQLVLTDSFSAFPILVSSAYPKQWVITNDRDFNEKLKRPYEEGVSYILVSKSKGSVYQVIHANYPHLFDEKEPWAELVRDFEGQWRLYRIIGSPAG